MAILIKKSSSWVTGQSLKISGTGPGMKAGVISGGEPSIIQFNFWSIYGRAELSSPYPDGFILAFAANYSGAVSAVIKRASDDAVVYDVYAQAAELSLNPASPGTIFYPTFTGTLGESYYLEINGSVQSSPVLAPDPAPAVTSFYVESYYSDEKGSGVNFAFVYTGNRLGTECVVRNVSTLLEYPVVMTSAFSAGSPEEVSGDSVPDLPDGTYVFVVNPGSAYEVTSAPVVVTNPVP